MAVSFNSIPSSGIRIPFAFFELNAGSSPSDVISSLLLYGPSSSIAQGVAANKPYQVTGLADVQNKFGANSGIAVMYQEALLANPFATLYCAASTNGGASASQTLTINIAPTSTGLFILYVADVQIAALVTPGMTTTQVAEALVANAEGLTSPQEFTLTNTANVVTISANGKGSNYNGTSVALAPYAGTDQTANALATLGGSTLTGGVDNPNTSTELLTLQTNMGDMAFDFIGSAFSDAASLSSWSTFLASRWGWESALYGQYYGVIQGAVAAITTFGLALNSPDLVITELVDVSSSALKSVAGIAAVAEMHLASGPECSRPMQGLQIPGLAAVYSNIGVMATIRNTFLYSGISTLTVDASGAVYFDRLITTYQTTPFGVPDSSWLNANRKNQARVALRYMSAYVAANYGRCALVTDNPYNLQNFVMPSDIQTGLTHAYNNLQAQGIVDNAAVFSQYLVVEANASDPDRVDAYLPMEFVNQLIVFAGNMTAISASATASVSSTTTNSTAGSQ